jgi:molybdopterin-guanine dinucleotide biosynthesis protein A
MRQPKVLSAIILAGGNSNRMNQDKGLSILSGIPLVEHVINKVTEIVEELILIVKDETQKQRYLSKLDYKIIVKTDVSKISSPIIGTITGLSCTKADYTLILACDMPFVSKQAIKILFEEAKGHNGAVFQHPNGWIEPLCAVYKVEPALKQAMSLYNQNNLRIRMILKKMEDVTYIPIKTLKEIDPTLLTFFDVDTESSLKEAHKIINVKNHI